MKVFISQPMHGLSDEDILATRDKVIKMLEEKYGNIEVIDTFLKPDAPEGAGRLWYLGNSISLLDKADAAYFVEGWKKAKGCNVEYTACALYGVKILND